eukprot:1604967-Pyramimonas_sp.AAC.1
MKLSRQLSASNLAKHFGSSSRAMPDREAGLREARLAGMRLGTLPLRLAMPRDRSTSAPRDVP